ncbi:FtsX-like permease family protein [Streptomyces sp. L7]
MTGIDGVAGAPRTPGGTGPHPVAVQDGGGFGRLTAGRWPAGTADAPAGAFTSLPEVRVSTGSTDPVDTAVPDALAKRLGIGPGSSLRVQDAFNRAMTLRITGVFRATGAVGFWPAMAGDLAEGETADQDLLVVSPSALNGSAVLNGHLTAHWSVQPDLSRLDADGLTALRDRLRAFSGSRSGVSVFRGHQPSLADVTVASGLPGAIDDLTVPTVAARSSLYLPGVLLAVLALATLVLAARELTVRRREELALQQARGAGTPRLLRGAAVEWAVTGVPAAVAAPFLAGLLHPGRRGTDAWAAVGLTLLVHAAAVLLPVLPSAGSRPTRSARAAAAQRLGADLALLAVAALGYLELRRHHSLIADMGTGSASADPVLVLVPTLVAGAAALLLLRLLPLTSLLLDAFGRRGRGLVLPLAGWQLGRRAARNAGPVVLMCLAMSVSAFATTALASSGRPGLRAGRVHRRRGRADHPVGGRRLPLLRPGRRLSRAPGGDRRGPGDAVDGEPARRRHRGPGRHGRRTRSPHPGTGRPRHTAPRASDRAAAGRTAAQRRQPRGTEPGADRAGRVRPRQRRDHPAAHRRRNQTHRRDPPRRGAERRPPEGLSTDRDGRQRPATAEHASRAPGPGADPGRRARHHGQLGHPAPRRAGLGRRHRPRRRLHRGRLQRAVGRQLRTRHLRGVLDRSGWFRGTADHHQHRHPALPGGLGRLRRSVRQRLRHPGRQPGAAGRRPGGRSGAASGARRRDDAAPGTAGRGRHDHAGPGRGPGHGPDRGRGRLTARTRPRSGHLIADQRQLSTSMTQAGVDQEDPAFWWLGSTDSARTAAAVEAQPALGGVTTTARTTASLRADLFREGLRRTLELVRGLAPGFAVIAFTVHAVVSTRQRRKEFALLRAIGVRAKSLSALLGAEQLSLALFAVVPGALMGMALAAAGAAAGHRGRQRAGPLSAATADHPLGDRGPDRAGDRARHQRGRAGTGPTAVPGGPGACGASGEDR